MISKVATFFEQLDFLRVAPLNVATEDRTDYFTILWVAVIALPVHFAFFVLFFANNIPVLAHYNVFSLFVWLLVINLARRTLYSEALLLAGTEVILHASLVTMLLGTSFGFHLYLWPAACIIAIHTQTRVFSATLFALLTFGIFIFLELNFKTASVDNFLNGYELYFYSFCLITGGIPFIVGMMSMKSVYIRQRQSVEQYANIDQLTGLYNRRHFYNALHFRKFQTSKENKCFGIAIGDIDKFKPLNDNLGHEEGDKVLKQVASIIKGSIGKSDSACRWGGEEFLIYLDDYSAKSGNELLDRIRKDIQSKVTGINGEGMTISFGAVFAEGDFSLDEVVNYADSLLYKAKSEGRNKVITAYYFNKNQA